MSVMGSIKAHSARRSEVLLLPFMAPQLLPGWLPRHPTLTSLPRQIGIANSPKAQSSLNQAGGTAMPTLHFITHPEVAIDPSVPVSDWPLSLEGVRRMSLALERPWMSRPAAVFSSAERKATDAAHLVADRFGLPSVIVAELGENDRSVTGYLPKAEFEATADLFFAHPERSVRGWERAVDAQRRIVAAVDQVIADVLGPGGIAVLSHGGVGSLLLCHLKGVPISRSEDQPGVGGGCVYSFDTGTRALLSGWRLIED